MKDLEERIEFNISLAFLQGKDTTDENENSSQKLKRELFFKATFQEYHV